MLLLNHTGMHAGYRAVYFMMLSKQNISLHTDFFFMIEHIRINAKLLVTCMMSVGKKKKKKGITVNTSGCRGTIAVDLDLFSTSLGVVFFLLQRI